MSTKDKIPGKDTVYVDVDDDITQIIDKVESAKQKVVALVLPKRAAILQSIVNMRLLKRAADNSDKSIVLITGEDALLPLAGAAGLHVAKDLQSKPDVPSGPEISKQPASAEKIAVKKVDSAAELPTKIDYGKSVGELAAVHEHENPETIELGDEKDPVEAAADSAQKIEKPKKIKQKGIKVPNFDKFRLMLGLGIVGLIALIVFIVLAVAVLPKATIAIQTSSTPVSANLTVNASGSAKSVDTKNNIVPAYLKTSDQTTSQQVTATGQQNNGTKATGSVTLSAGACGPTYPSDVPAGTGISTNGLTYITQATASFSAVNSGGQCTFQSNSVGIVAQQGGAKYNTSINSAAVANSTATANGSASGGTDNITTILSQNDVDNVVNQFKSSNSDAYAKNFESSLSNQGYYVLSSTLKTGDPQTSANPAVGQATSNSTVSIKITYSVLCIKKDDLVKVIDAALQNQIDPTKQKVQPPDVINGANISVVSQGASNTATLSVSESAPAVPIINQAQIKQEAEGKKSGDITAMITNIPGVKSVNVKFSPFWVSKAPKNPSKITVTTSHSSGSTGG